jgi:hypothetical protein
MGLAAPISLFVNGFQQIFAKRIGRSIEDGNSDCLSGDGGHGDPENMDSPRQIQVRYTINTTACPQSMPSVVHRLEVQCANPIDFGAFSLSRPFLHHSFSAVTKQYIMLSGMNGLGCFCVRFACFKADKLPAVSH